MNQQEVSRFIKILKELQGKESQRNLAKKIGVSPYSLNTWITKKAFPNRDNFIKVAKYMGITIDDLLAKIKNNNDLSNTLPQTSASAYQLFTKLARQDKLNFIKLILQEYL